MEERILILKTLEKIKEGTGQLPLNNLEIIINSSSKIKIEGIDFLELLKNMVEEGLLATDDNQWYFSITSAGIDYLDKNS